MTPADFDRKQLEHALVLLFHYTNGLKASRKHPLASVNRHRVEADAEALEYLSEFAEANIREVFQ